MRRLIIPALVSLLSLGGMVVTADALVTTPGEELETFLDDVTAPHVDKRLDAALSYIDPGDVPCRLNADGKLVEYGKGEASDLAAAVRSALSVFDTDSQQTLQHAVEINGEDATVTTRLGDSDYEQTVIYELVRHDRRWLVRAVRAL